MTDTQKNLDEEDVRKTAEFAVSIDGNDVADDVLGQVSELSEDNYHYISMNAVATILRRMGTTIHILDWTVSKLLDAAELKLKEVATQSRLDPQWLAQSVLAWLRSHAATDIYGMLVKKIPKGARLTMEQSLTLSAIEAVLRNSIQ